ncbi:hypothetical protein ACJJTC_006876 [Scirpophaga incertulas]
MHVCHKHFKRRFVNARTNHLKTGAYPTLFSDLEISSGYPSNVRVTDTNVTTCREHDYSRNRHFDHSYAQASDDQSPNKVAHVEISELVEPSSSSLTEINTFASTSSQEATTGYIIIR